MQCRHFSFPDAGGGSKEADSPKGAPQQQVEQQKPAEQPKQVEYTPADVTVMMDELENNAAAAQKKYKGQYLKITGKLGAIDSNMKYISVIPNRDFAILGVHCDLKAGDKTQEDYVMSLSKGQQVTAYGQITDVGEVMGYYMKVDKFE